MKHLLRKIKTDAGMSIREMAKKIGRHEFYLYKDSKLTVKDLKAICRITGAELYIKHKDGRKDLI